MNFKQNIKKAVAGILVATSFAACATAEDAQSDYSTEIYTSDLRISLNRVIKTSHLNRNCSGPNQGELAVPCSIAVSAMNENEDGTESFSILLAQTQGEAVRSMEANIIDWPVNLKGTLQDNKIIYDGKYEFMDSLPKAVGDKYRELRFQYVTPKENPYAVSAFRLNAIAIVEYEVVSVTNTHMYQGLQCREVVLHRVNVTEEGHPMALKAHVFSSAQELKSMAGEQILTQKNCSQP